PIRELTRFEYGNTVRDLLGSESAVADAFVGDAVQGVFARNSGRVVNEQLAEQYMRAAEQLAAEVDVSTLAACSPSTPEDEVGCVESFVRSFGRRAFRRPPGDARIARYVALYEATRGDPDLALDFEGALRVVLEAMLQSPLFLHHVEYGDPTAADERGRVPLVPYELASRLSYTMWGSMPDDALLDAAESGELADPAQLEAHARRLLEDPRARAAVARFYAQWFDLHRIDNAAKSSERYPELDAALRESMRGESERFLDELLWGDAEGTVAELFTADFTFVDADLAAVYGIDVGELPAGEWTRVDGLPDGRRGMLGHGAFLASHATAEESSPVHRGVFVRDRLMCQPIPLPTDFNPTLPEPLPGETPPELVERHLSDPSCAGCHTFFDPIGLGFENYDGIGAVRDAYLGGDVVDARGEIVGSQDGEIDGTFEGLLGLTEKLASSEQVRACVAQQANMFALGAEAGSQCVSDELEQAFVASGGDLRELMIEVVRSEAFRLRADDDAETPAGACP
ncbi:MAG: DUF1592 domain-containing protein, partial [Deltaproteobacteria bacterium]|nr:DUF1592 domain-containing protein [Nannocystaceae bacterium]